LTISLSTNPNFPVILRLFGVGGGTIKDYRLFKLMKGCSLKSYMIKPSICPSVHLSICVFSYLSLSLYTGRQSLCLFVYSFVHYPPVCVSFCGSTSLYVYQSILTRISSSSVCIFISPPVYFSVNLCPSPSILPPVLPYVPSSVHLSVSGHLIIHLIVCLSGRLSIIAPVYPICLSTHMSVYLSVCLSLCSSVCLSCLIKKQKLFYINHNNFKPT
jgi:hypothetical protein